MAVAKEESKKRSFTKTLLITLISFIALALLTVSILYFSNESFKENSNKVLSGLPGGIGNYFKAVPTKNDLEEIKNNIAKYYISLDKDRIVDKLLIVKGEDENLYNDLIVLMSRKNSSKMKSVKEELKLFNLKNDPINRILDEIDKDNEEKINSLQKYYSSLTLSSCIDEIERMHLSGEVSTDDLVHLFQILKPDQASKYLFYLDQELTRQIKYKLSTESLEHIEKKLYELETKQKKMFDLVLEYDNKNMNASVEELGNLKTYSMGELAFIFKELSLDKSSKILSMVDDNNFMLTLFEEINHLQELEKETPNISPAIIKGVSIYKDYNKKTSELADIYDKTSVDELVKILEMMLKRNEIYKRYPLIESEEIIFSEEQLVIDVLNKLKPNKVASLLEKMNEDTRIILSKKLLN